MPARIPGLRERRRVEACARVRPPLLAGLRSPWHTPAGGLAAHTSVTVPEKTAVTCWSPPPARGHPLLAERPARSPGTPHVMERMELPGTWRWSGAPFLGA